MPRFPEAIPVKIRVGDCTCPPKKNDEPPHPDGDFVTLEPSLPPGGGMAALRAVSRLKTGDDAPAAVMAAILPHVVREWTFLDVKSGQPLEVNPASIREALPWTQGGMEVAAKAFDLYWDEATNPLASKRSRKTSATPSPSTPTALTSAKTSSSSKRRTRSA